MSKNYFHCPAVPNSKRSTERVYTHCVVGYGLPVNSADARINGIKPCMRVLSWSGSHALAVKASARFNHHTDVRVEPVIQVDKNGNPINSEVSA